MPLLWKLEGQRWFPDTTAANVATGNTAERIRTMDLLL